MIVQRCIWLTESKSYSHASLLSKDVRQIANACRALMGHVKSMVNISLPTFPNCNMTRSSSSASSTSWKFFTDACVTRPLKLRQYACICSFHRGDLFTSTHMSPRRPCLKLSRMPCAPSRVVATNFVRWPPPSGPSTAGMYPFIFRGPRVPSTLYSYVTAPRSCRGSKPADLPSGFSPGLLPLSKMVNSVPRKFDRSFAKKLPDCRAMSSSSSEMT
mmetsp:Transcript_212/g.1001  ORF Transcript_212/g.1001 Transcript_212/m.1001 type:complete len:216 (+) Transcript_212:766-1413(+)